jgi:hypothetical protein
MSSSVPVVQCSSQTTRCIAYIVYWFALWYFEKCPVGGGGQWLSFTVGISPYRNAINQIRINERVI